jgi:hypothetical protein
MRVELGEGLLILARRRGLTTSGSSVSYVKTVRDVAFNTEECEASVPDS